MPASRNKREFARRSTSTEKPIPASIAMHSAISGP